MIRPRYKVFIEPTVLKILINFGNYYILAPTIKTEYALTFIKLFKLEK